MKSAASAPGKVILFGEHFVVYGVGAILCAIDKRAVVSARTVQQNVITIESEIGRFSGSPETELSEVDGHLRPLFHLTKTLVQEYGQKQGVTIDVKSEIPPGVGLGSSSACCVAGSAAVSSLFGIHDMNRILNLAVQAEKTIHQDSSGADCTISTHGGLAEYSKEGKFVQIESKMDLRMIIANSNVEHSTGSMVSKVRQFKEANSERFSEMTRMESELVRQARGLIRRGDLEELGRCMVKNQRLLEEIGVSSRKLDEMVDIANETSFGSKITGSGGGGCILALGDDSGMQDTIRHLNDSGIECFPVKIDRVGLDTF